MEIEVGDRIDFNFSNKKIENALVVEVTEVYVKVIIEGNAVRYIAQDRITKFKRPCQYKTIYKKQEILDREEKEYLRAVIKPFRDSVRCINKILIGDSDEYIEIEMNKNDDISLPYFRRGTMYKGMKRGKNYTLEELGL